MTVLSNMTSMGHEEVLFCSDNATGLKAIIAIHDTTLGPALGGCRFWDYKSEDEALEDVLRLSRGMTYKAAVSGLNLGGGKAVIIGDPKKLKSESFFRTFGRFVDSLNGRYITAEDVNMSVRDIEWIGAETRYITGISSGSGDPSPITALGVFSGIRASVKHKLGKDSLRGIKVAIQGVGSVGSHLCALLNDAGASLYITDIDKERVKDIAEEYRANIANSDEIHALDVDVYSPCALGATLNDQTIPEIKAPIISGGANNQLQDEGRHGGMLKERNILYSPDYVINAGGLINVYHEIKGYDEKAARKQATGIYDTLLDIYREADAENIPTHLASDRIAEKRLASAGAMKDLRNTIDNQLWYKR